MAWRFSDRITLNFGSRLWHAMKSEQPNHVDYANDTCALKVEESYAKCGSPLAQRSSLVKALHVNASNLIYALAGQ